MPTTKNPWGPTGPYNFSRRKKRGKSKVTTTETRRITEEERLEAIKQSYATHDGRKKAKKRGRAKGSKNKNTRKDKGAKKGRRAKPGMLVAELRKTISKWKKKNKVEA